MITTFEVTATHKNFTRTYLISSFKAESAIRHVEITVRLETGDDRVEYKANHRGRIKNELYANPELIYSTEAIEK